MDKVRLVRVAVHLQTHFVIDVFQLRGGYQVVPLDVRQVVHGLPVSPVPAGLPVDVPESQAHHAQQHEQGHQAHSQGNCRPLEAILDLPAHWQGHSKVLAAGAGEAGRADAGGRGLPGTPSPGADTPVQTGLEGALLQGPVAVPSGVAWGTGAGVVVDAVEAGASVDAGVTGALVDVDLTVHAGEARLAATHTHATVNHAQTTCGEMTGLSASKDSTGTCA